MGWARSALASLACLLCWSAHASAQSAWTDPDWEANLPALEAGAELIARTPSGGYFAGALAGNAELIRQRAASVAMYVHGAANLLDSHTAFHGFWAALHDCASARQLHLDLRGPPAARDRAAFALQDHVARFAIWASAQPAAAPVTLLVRLGPYDPETGAFAFTDAALPRGLPQAAFGGPEAWAALRAANQAQDERYWRDRELRPWSRAQLPLVAYSALNANVRANGSLTLELENAIHACAAGATAFPFSADSRFFWVNFPQAYRLPRLTASPENAAAWEAANPERLVLLSFDLRYLPGLSHVYQTSRGEPVYGRTASASDVKYYSLEGALLGPAPEQALAVNGTLTSN